MPFRELTKSGGNFHGLQLWVNLPKKDKMIKPRYQDISSSKKVLTNKTKIMNISTPNGPPNSSPNILQNNAVSVPLTFSLTFIMLVMILKLFHFLVLQMR